MPSIGKNQLTTKVAFRGTKEKQARAVFIFTPCFDTKTTIGSIGVHETSM